MLETLRIFWRLFKKYRTHIVVLTVLGFMSAILEGIGINTIVPLFSFFMGEGGAPTDFISNSLISFFGLLHIPFTFRYVLLFIMVLFVIRAIFLVVFGYIKGYITADFLSNETEAVFKSTLRASWPYLLRQRLGTIHSTAIRDVQQSAALLTMQVQVIQSATGLLMYLLVAFNISPLTTVLTLLAGGTLFFAVRPLVRRVTRMAGDMARTEKNVSQFLTEHMIGMKIVKAAGVEESALKVSTGYINTLRSGAIRLSGLQALSSSLTQPFMLLFIGVVFLVSYKSGTFSIVSFAATLYLIQKTFTYIDSAQGALQGIAAMMPYARNLLLFKESLAQHQEEVVAGTKPFLFKKHIEFKEVSLSYDKGPQVLKNISFTVQKGATIGLVGPSGSGKTSLADLLLRLFEPTEGTITVDGVSADEIGRSEWRSKVGYVAQDVFLLNGSIEENICFYRTGISHEEVVAAAKAANIHAFIETLPEGYNTTTGDRGVMLSGGQRQRVALARALLGEPELLVLDEATSALDSESESLIQEAITSLKGSVTVVIIAHRLSTIEHADIVYVLKDGQIQEKGTPSELYHNPDSYLYKHSSF